MDKIQKAALKFAAKYPEWNTFASDKPTVTAICGLHNCGLIKVNEFGQFKITQFGKDRLNND